MSIFKNKLHILIMIIIWVVGALFLGITHYKSRSQKQNNLKQYKANFNKAIKLLSSGGYSDYLSAWASFDKAAKFKHSDMLLWAQLSYMESSMAWEYQVKRGLYERYRGLGLNLISEQGEDTINSQNEPIWVVSSSLQRLAFPGNPYEFKEVLWLANYYSGLFPGNPDVELLKARAFLHNGKLDKTLGIIPKLPQVPSVLYLGAFTALEKLNIPLARTYLKKIQEKSVNSEYRTLLECLLENKCDKKGLETLAAHTSPNVREFASFNLYRIKELKTWVPGDTNLAFIYIMKAMDDIKSGKTDEVAVILEKLSKIRSNYDPKILIMAELNFLEGRACKASKLMDKIEGNFHSWKARYQWFCGNFKVVAKSPDLRWKSLAEGKFSSNDPEMVTASTFRQILENGKLAGIPEKLDKSVYSQYIKAKWYQSKFIECGVNKEQCLDHIKNALKYAKSLPSTKLFLSTAASIYYYNGDGYKALQKLRALCFLGVKKKTRGSVCPSSEAESKDRELMVKILTGSLNPESDQELAMGQAEKLLRFITDKDLSIYYRIRVGLMKIKLLPGASEQIVNQMSVLYDPATTFASLHEVASLLDVHRGKFREAREKWVKYFKNSPGPSLELTQLLYDFGQVQIIEEIATEILKDKELRKKCTLDFKYMMARSMNLRGEVKAWPIIDELKKEKFESQDFNLEYLTAALNLKNINKNSEEFSLRCKIADEKIKAIRKSNKEGASYFRVMKLLTCDNYKPANDEIIKEVNSIPSFHPFRKMAEKLVKR